MHARHALALALSVLLAACASTPSGAPRTREAATAAVLERLAVGDRDGALALYDDHGRARRDADALLGPLYDAARQRFQRGEPRVAADVLGLLAEREPSSVGIAEARVHALFLTRARQGREPALTDELEQAVAALRALAPGRPGWADLAAAQAAVDRGDVAAAGSNFATFERAWTGYPEELAPYVDDMRRYLEAHGSAGTR